MVPQKESRHNQSRCVPVGDYVLAYVAMRLIESSNDYRKYVMTPRDLIKACDMYWGLQDPIEVESERNSDSCLLRITCNQLEYNRPIHYLLPRTFAIYRDLWPKVQGAVPVESVIETISGLNIEEILVMSFAFSMRARKGFFRLYPESLTTDPRISDIFTPEKQQAFVDWVARGYREFREVSKTARKRAPGVHYEKFRFNPLVKYPAIKPDRNPVPGDPPVHLLPVARLLLDRVTRGLYFELSDHFQGPGGENPFRNSFGHVFQEYVGELLRQSVGKDAVLPERKYGRGNIDSTDWIAFRGDRCILVEVKQSGIFLNSKLWGDMEEVKRDLSRTVGKGARQLWTFEQAIRSGKYKELADLSRFREFERLVVTHDRAYLSNSVLREGVLEKLNEDSTPLPEDFHWHLISIDEFEYLLGLRDPDIFDVLRAKRLHPDDDAMDFGDFLGRRYTDRSPANEYLERIKERFFSSFEL